MAGAPLNAFLDSAPPVPRGVFSKPVPAVPHGVFSSPTPTATGALHPAPDYESQILSDPNYLAWQTNSNQALADAATTRKAAIQALVEQYGGLPTGFTDKYGDLSSADLNLATQNPYSTEADLKRAYGTNVLNMKKALAARGALHSGDLGYNQNQVDTQYGQDQYNAGQQFAQQLQAAISSYTGAVSADNSAKAQAIAQAYQDIIGNSAYVPTS